MTADEGVAACANQCSGDCGVRVRVAAPRQGERSARQQGGERNEQAQHRY
jgi:hypothetical protein